jgi:phosphoglycerol transferase MdoB-like AlkP superfamily enzyme
MIGWIDEIPRRIQFIFRLWIVCLILFTIGRLYYAIDYRSILFQEPFTVSELFGVFVSAIRFDISVSTMLIVPVALLAGYTEFIGSNRLVKRFEAFARAWIVIAASFCIALVLVDHYFYIYFKDHFNVFFWEFWENLNNSTLVIDGLGGVLPIWQTVCALVIGVSFLLLTIKFCMYPLRQADNLVTTVSRTKSTWWAVVVVALPIGLRGTFQHRPLTLQNFHEVYSQNDLINLLHTNPLFPLIRALSEYREVREYAYSREVDQSTLVNDLRDTASAIPGAEVKSSPSGFSYLNQRVEPVWPKYLVRRPKHVVLIVMESYSSWPMNYGGSFSDEMSANMKSLIREGMLFDAHFPSSGGTVKNLLSMNYSFAVPRDFYPAMLYHKEAYKKFPGLMPTQMRKLGLEPHFFYAGLSSWHRLYQFVPNIGYEPLHSSVEFDQARQHKHGSYDDAMFTQAELHLQKANTPQFLLLMSLTNHPPFNLPPEVLNRNIEIPQEIRDRLLGDENQFYDRFRAFQFSDQALGQFIANAKKQSYFADTLFVITGENGFGGALSYPPQSGWKEEQIPLVFYAPHLLRKEFVATVRRDYSSHIDIVPTLVGLMTETAVDIPTWGRNLLQGDGPTDGGINFYFSCYESVCLKREQLYFLDEGRSFQALPASLDQQQQRDFAKRREKSFYNSALGYFYGFKE